jgi:hypothetical protein
MGGIRQEDFATPFSSHRSGAVPERNEAAARLGPQTRSERRSSFMGNKYRLMPVAAVPSARLLARGAAERCFAIRQSSLFQNTTPSDLPPSSVVRYG